MMSVGFAPASTAVVYTYGLNDDPVSRSDCVARLNCDSAKSRPPTISACAAAFPRPNVFTSFIRTPTLAVFQLTTNNQQLTTASTQPPCSADTPTPKNPHL